MATRREKRVGRGAIEKCWYLAEELTRIQQDIRYANKPSDLYYPMSELSAILRRLYVFQAQWLGQWCRDRGERLSLWPKIWERYL